MLQPPNKGGLEPFLSKPPLTGLIGSTWNMAKRSELAFLVAFLKQVRKALDDGLEEAYILAELIIELDDLILAPESDTDGPGVDEVGESDTGCRSEAAEDAVGDDSGSEDSQPAPDVCRVVRPTGDSRESLHGRPLANRGTGSRPAAGLRVPQMRRVPSGT